MTIDARRAFLAELIDDAGLFPPASLSMDAAVEQHVASRAGPFHWMLGRFICPASRLPELAKHLVADERWRLSVIADLPPAETSAATEDFLAEAGGRASVELV